MNFGQALEKVKAGDKIFRHGWNGKGMFVVYQKGYQMESLVIFRRQGVGNE